MKEDPPQGTKHEAATISLSPLPT